jgi:hypothetical protein
VGFGGSASSGVLVLDTNGNWHLQAPNGNDIIIFGVSPDVSPLYTGQPTRGMVPFENILTEQMDGTASYSTTNTTDTGIGVYSKLAFFNPGTFVNRMVEYEFSAEVANATLGDTVSVGLYVGADSGANPVTTSPGNGSAYGTGGQNGWYRLHVCTITSGAAGEHQIASGSGLAGIGLSTGVGGGFWFSLGFFCNAGTATVYGTTNGLGTPTHLKVKEVAQWRV